MNPESFPFPAVDCHVHLSPSLTIDRAMQLSHMRGVRFGIVEHPGAHMAIPDDAALARYLDLLEPYPVYKGLQPVFPGWKAAFSSELLARLDYILMDALTLPQPDGSWLEIWRPNTPVADPQAFMLRYLDFCARVLTEEPINIFGWPTFLPDSIAAQYDSLWTEERMQRLIALAATRRIAIEINEFARVPGARFIRLAKQAGLKFTFGTDSRDERAGVLTYGLAMVKNCGLAETDMFSPAASRPS